MGLRQRQWARGWRLKLRRLLGLCCKECGSRDYRKLQFDCIVSTGVNHYARMDWSWRMSFYRQQHKLNNLQLLCEHCHGLKSCKEMDREQ